MAVTRPPLSVPHRVFIAAILLLGALGSVAGYWTSWRDEEERARMELGRRTSLRQALSREVLRRYEDSLFGLSSLLMRSATVSRVEFMRATERLQERMAGAEAYEWVPLVAHGNRAEVEAVTQRAYPRQVFAFTEYEAGGQPRRAADRPYYYPICFVQPFRGNEAALGYDLNTGPTLAYLERARATGRMVVTDQIQLVQDRTGRPGVVMIQPVFRPPGPVVQSVETAGPAQDEFLGFLQSVFRVRELLATVHSPQPDPILDVLFVDGSEKDPARRVMHYRAEDETGIRDALPTEEEFRRSATTVIEYALPFGGRDWRVLYRPRAGWIGQQHTATPALRGGGILLLAGLMAGLISVLGRRTETIRNEVNLRTAELAESRRQFASMVHALPGMAFRCTYDDQLTVLFLSEGAGELTGWSAEEFLASRMHFRDLIHPDDVARVRDATRAALQGHKDFEIEYRIQTRAGAQKWILTRGRGVYGGDGLLDFFEGLAIDVTAQKNAEAARLELERKLLEGQKLESLGLLAGGIAHDFNNLLCTIVGNAGMVRSQLPAATSFDAPLAAVETASRRAAELCRQMLAYAGKGNFVIEPVDLTLLTEELLPLLRVSVLPPAKLRLELARDLPPVLADATQLRQIEMNLVLNAVDAIGERPGEIVLTTGVMRVDPGKLAGCVAGAELPAADYVFLEVCDNGAGMTPEVRAKIFDPFFTTKFAGRGLGLAAVLGIVRGHRGALSVTSAPETGSAFRLLLPPGPRVTAAPKIAATGAPPGRWKRSGNVLVVEDEEAVREVVMAMLKFYGLSPTGAVDGEKGLAAFRANPGAVDLVMLDLVMPNLNGEQTLAAMRAIRPDVRVLLMSGYSKGDILGRLAGPGRLAFMAKPFTRETLEQRLREMLD